ncbi:BTAD domain-containing putative transcriptional regulator [Streptomyces sp. SS7]|uniref:AfsR/SARP family transcriptional regulator n=1 Tax=Streptomyces sp. SS7 TaxID=3108485 RepID=UPI0030EC3B8C
MTVLFTLLGDIGMRVGTRPVNLGPALQRAVLAALLVDAPHAVSVDRLAERVWGDRLPGRSRDSLYSYLSRLRTALSSASSADEAARIAKEPGGYRLIVNPDAVDLHRFRALVASARAEQHDDTAADLFAQALRLWRSEPFATMDTPWFNALRDVLGQERLEAELDRNETELRRGRHAGIFPELYRQAEKHPLDERLAGQLMLTLYRCGRTADALDHYETVRVRLAEELGIDPGAPLRRLHQQILTAHPSLDHPVPGPDAASVLVPHQLPAPPGVFTGRGPELERLDRALGEHRTGGTVVISAIGGIGGVGKSWLALRWAHQNAERFPDGQLYVNLHGFDPASAPMAPTAAARRLLGALGVDPANIPADPEAVFGLYRSLLAGKSLLIVLDDARNADQVRPLLPGSASCTVLVTSRKHLTSLVTTHSAQLLQLTVFEPAEARDLLVRHLGTDRIAAEPGPVATLIECCAGLPLALGITAARAAAHPDFPLAVLADELRETTGRLDALETGDLTASLRGVFATSYQALTPAARRLFALLGPAPGPDIGLAAAASLAGLPPARARALLTELETAHLVEQHRPGRYRTHDLLRLYGTEIGDGEPAEARAALDRVTDFYLHTAFAAVSAIEGPDTPFRPRLAPPVPGCTPMDAADRGTALEWFAAEHACLIAAQGTALSQGRHDAVWQLAWTLINFHLSGHHLEEYHALWHTALTAVAHLDDQGPRILTHWRYGHARALKGEFTDALAHLGNALGLAEDSADTAAQAHILRTLGWVWEQSGDCQQALEHSVRALHLYLSLDNTFWQANQLNAVGWLYAQLGRYEEAESHCEEALALFRESGRAGAEASTLDSLGYVAHRTGRWESALSHYEQALALFRSIGAAYDEADTLAHLGDTHEAMGHSGPARTAWRQALGLYRAQNRAGGAERMGQLLGEAEAEGAAPP